MLRFTRFKISAAPASDVGFATAVSMSGGLCRHRDTAVFADIVAITSLFVFCGAGTRLA
jgi:hypothetical protein